MNSKKLFVILFLLLSAVLLFGCTKNTEVPPETAKTTQIESTQKETEKETESATVEVTETDADTTKEVPETDAETTEDIKETEYQTKPPYLAEGGYFPVSLMYHCVNETPTTPNTLLFVRPAELENQFRFIKDNGIETLFADEFSKRATKSVIFTFDDGYEDNYTYMFPLAKKYSVKVTVYLIAYKIDMPGYLTSSQIKEMQDSGLVQFGSHTLDHPDLTTLCEEDIRKQFGGANWIISQKTGKVPSTLAYPTGLYDDSVVRIAREFYRFAYTMDDASYTAQDDLLLPRYAILREHTLDQFKIFIGY